MNTKLFLLLFSSFLLEATAAGFNHHRGTNRRQELRRPQANAQELDRSRRYHEPRSDNLDSEARLAAQDFGVSSEDACPAVASMPDCGATCINSVAPAQGCPVTGDISCNCKNSKQIQSAAQDCVLSLCGPITAISVVSAASAICEQCAPATATVAAAAEVTNKRLLWLGDRAEQGTKTLNMRAASPSTPEAIPEQQVVDGPWLDGKAEATKRPTPDEDAEVGQAGKRQDRGEHHVNPECDGCENPCEQDFMYPECQSELKNDRGEIIGKG
ncbi:hypothetical protein QBC42DRAFT_333402 [Cladorrhinum samala]|uniref:CFEM domain-containing protein n=1 Tax=Cladorrhinum samala TaxID=585594 RepID=A0AAV9HM34_9PEZI|nr:hypothetical protein QBC42DRAFT_333402 [Cladorrhinum samala]